MKLFTKNLIIVCLLAFAFSSCNETTTTNDAADNMMSEVLDKDAKYFEMNDQGQLIRPKDYRTWIYIGTPLTPNDLNNGKATFQEFHNVYIDPVSYEHYKETGLFRENTIIMKELISVGSKAAVSGNGYFMGDFIGLEATIKSKELFPDEPGNWVYYSFTNHETGLLTEAEDHFASGDCNACHDASAQDDFVFTQHYPVLRAAKAVGGNVIPEDAAKRTATGGHSGADATDIWAATAETPNDPSLKIPLDKEGLFAYLKEGKYKSFKYKEEEKHPSLGPHTALGLPVQVYMNDILGKSLEAKSKEHPKGAIMIKEMFSKDNVLSGWAVMVKTQDKSDDGKGWFWYEVTSASDLNEIPAMGNGVVGCASCHKVGQDMVRTAFPLK